MPFPSGHVVIADEFNAANNQVNVRGNCSANDTSTNSAYQSLTSTNSSVSFTKRLASTAVRVDLHITALSTVSATTMVLGVLLGGVDYDIDQFVFSSASVRQQASGTGIIAAGQAAGTYTAQLRWKRSAGTGTLQRFTPDDWQSLTVAEVFQ